MISTKETHGVSMCLLICDTPHCGSSVGAADEARARDMALAYGWDVGDDGNCTCDHCLNGNTPLDVANRYISDAG